MKIGSASGLGSPFPSVKAQENLSPREIVDRAFNVTKLAGSEAVLTMTIIDGKDRERF